tara:strand:- start:375 stop:557 length:183 start_codon:yes stop_codon:yes gene_type:complete
MPIIALIILLAGAKTIENNQLCVVDGPQTPAEVQYCADLADLDIDPPYTGPMFSAPAFNF